MSGFGVGVLVTRTIEMLSILTENLSPVVARIYRETASCVHAYKLLLFGKASPGWKGRVGGGEERAVKHEQAEWELLPSLSEAC